MSSADVTTGPSLDVGKLRLAPTASDDEMTNRDAELIRRIREFGARLGEHGDELDEVLSQIPGDTLVPALRHLARVVRRMGMEPRLSPELRVVLDQMGSEACVTSPVGRGGASATCWPGPRARVL